MTGDDFIRSVKRAASIPTAQATFSEQDFLEMANEEVSNFLMPLILAAREEHYLVDVDYPFAQNGRYRIPSRAHAHKLRDVSLLLSDGRELPDIPRISFDQRATAQYGFYIKGAYIHLVGVTQAATVRLTVHLSPGRLVKLASAAKITAKTTTTVTLASVPAGWAGTFLVDFIKGDAPYDTLSPRGFTRAVSIAGSVLTLADADEMPDDLEIGDYVALVGESPFVQAPGGLPEVLTQRVAVKCLQALGALEELGAAGAVLSQMQTDALELLEERAEGESPQIITTNPLFEE